MNDDPRKQDLIEHCQQQFIELIDVGLHQGGAELQKRVDDLPEGEVRLLLLCALGHQMHHIRQAAGASRN